MALKRILKYHTDVDLRLIPCLSLFTLCFLYIYSLPAVSNMRQCHPLWSGFPSFWGVSKGQLEVQLLFATLASAALRSQSDMKPDITRHRTGYDQTAADDFSTVVSAKVVILCFFNEKI